MRILGMDATFVEMPSFQRHRASYLDDEEYREFQSLLIRNPTSGDEIQGAGGLRKIRFRHKAKRKGSRGGLRIIYYWHQPEHLFWLFVLYSKGEASDLTASQKAFLKAMLTTELEARRYEL